MAILLAKAGQNFRRGSVARDQGRVLDLMHHEVSAPVLCHTDGTALELPVDAAHAPAVRAFLADRQEGMTGRQAALARAVLLARLVC